MNTQARNRGLWTVSITLFACIAVLSGVCLQQEITQSREEESRITVYRIVNWTKYFGYGEALLMPDSNLKDFSAQSKMALTDAWGNGLILTPKGKHNFGRFDIYSIGPNGLDEGGYGDDIGNWSYPNCPYGYTMDHVWSLVDLANEDRRVMPTPPIDP